MNRKDELKKQIINSMNRKLNQSSIEELELVVGGGFFDMLFYTCPYCGENFGTRNNIVNYKLYKKHLKDAHNTETAPIALIN